MAKIFSALVFGLGLASSPMATADLSEAHQQGMVYCVNGELNTFNPQLSRGGLTVDTLSAQLYDRLLDVDPYTYRLIPALAERWEVKDDGSAYLFHLKPGVPFQQTRWFHPTRVLDADDVVFSFARVFDKQHPWHKVNGGIYPYFDSLQFSKTVKSVRKIDPLTVEIKLNHSDASFLWHIATHYAPILSAEYAQSLEKSHQQEVLDQQPVGTGPFQLSEYRSGQFVRLIRHPGYWRGVPRLRQVVIDMGAGDTGRMSKLLTGECDVLAYPAASQLTVLRDDPRLRLILRPGMNIAYLAFNTRKPPLDNPKVRQALAWAINKQRLLASIYYGTAETAASILPRASWAYHSEASESLYSPEKARQALAALNVSHLKLKLMVPVTPQPWNPSQFKTAELIQADLAKVGVTVNIIPVDGRFQENQLISTNHDLTLAGWSTDSNDPDSFFCPMLSCAAIHSGTNYARWCNKDFEDTMQHALLSQKLSGRIAYYHQAQEILAAQLPVLPLASSLRLQAYRYDIKGLILSPFGNSSFAGVYRENSENQTP